MSSPDLSSLARGVARALRPLLPPLARTVLLGVGSELRRDDYAGSYAARLLTEQAGLSAARLPFLAIEGGTAPENLVGVIRSFRPDAVIVLDAAGMSLAPGSCAILSPDDITGATFSTHMLPLPVTLSYIEQTCGCRTAYIGIQPVSVAQGIGMDPRVKTGTESLVQELTAVMSQPAETIAGRNGNRINPAETSDRLKSQYNEQHI
ncbi:hydrogenase 3 maturation endopeptidase HyCI [Oscillospiraceae bacterium HV4-5-C5C]|nr:hydrogenase 3 maturation endopeptidase HyCI [Oscillospiraceae bacterium HV4-5-C5C]